MPPEASVWQRFMDDALARVRRSPQLEVQGSLTRVAGLVLEATGLRTPIGSQCLVRMPGQKDVLAEVVGFSGDRAFLMPAGDVHGLSSGASVRPASAFVPLPRLGEPESQVMVRSGVLRLPVGPGLLGRVVDPQGVPLDHQGPLTQVSAEPLAGFLACGDHCFLRERGAGEHPAELLAVGHERVFDGLDGGGRQVVLLVEALAGHADQGGMLLARGRELGPLLR